MLNPFPDLFVYSIFAPTLLRVVASVCFIYIAQHLVRNRKNIQGVVFPLIRKPRAWMVYVSITITLATAFLLFVGLRTQWAALLGLLLALKHAFVLKNYPSIRPFSISTYLLLATICLALLVLGAGVFAFDYIML